MISFHLGRRLVALQYATLTLPVYQKLESGTYSSSEDSEGSTESSITHRLLIPWIKLSVVQAAPEFGLTPEMFQDKT